jgi:hypothetical protein
MVRTQEVEEYKANKVQCLCGQYHADDEGKLGIVEYSAQQGSEIIERGTLYICPDCDLMPGLSIDWYRNSPPFIIKQGVEDK